MPSAAPQPTFGPFRAGRVLALLEQPQIMIGESGWQVQIPDLSRSAYFGRENVEPTTEAMQASTYAQIVRTVPCDSAMRAVLFFGLEDSPDLDRFQTGLMRADVTKRLSYYSVKDALARTETARESR